MDPRPHIVVVEDEATQRQLLADYLAEQNFRVSAVASGAALHRLVEHETPALVLLDVHLPAKRRRSVALINSAVGRCRCPALPYLEWAERVG